MTKSSQNWSQVIVWIIHLYLYIYFLGCKDRWTEWAQTQHVWINVRPQHWQINLYRNPSGYAANSCGYSSYGEQEGDGVKKGESHYFRLLHVPLH